MNVHSVTRDAANPEPLGQPDRLPRIQPDRCPVVGGGLVGDRLHVSELHWAGRGAGQHVQPIQHDAGQRWRRAQVPGACSAWQTASTVRSFLSPRSSPIT